MLTKISYNNFNKFRNKLLDYSRRFKIPFEDIEEIVNDSILKAIENFDSERGSFESLCIVILKHKVLNFKRDNSYLYFLVLLDENENIFEANDRSIEDKENVEMALKFLSKLRNELSEEERKLFNEIYDMCENSGKMSISKASKNIGVEPLKGWDLFRKIQRKASIQCSEKLEIVLYETSIDEESEEKKLADATKNFKDVFEKLNISISDESKNIGIEPLKGQNIFRIIQKTINAYLKEKIKLLKHLNKIQKNIVNERSNKSNTNEDQVSYEFSVIQFSEDAIKKLNSLYNFK